MTTEKVAEEIRALIPAESFREPYRRDYDTIWTKAMAEDLLEKLPKDYTLAETEEHGLIVTKQDPEMEEGFEKFVHDSTKIHLGLREDSQTFAEHLEEFINTSHWRKFVV